MPGPAACRPRSGLGARRGRQAHAAHRLAPQRQPAREPAQQRGRAVQFHQPLPQRARERAPPEYHFREGPQVGVDHDVGLEARILHADLDVAGCPREQPPAAARHPRAARSQRDQAVDQLIGLVGAVDGICQVQAKADAEYFVQVAGRGFGAEGQRAIHATTLAAYRWQYILSGVQDARFLEILGTMVNAEQGARISAALAPIAAAVH